KDGKPTRVRLSELFTPGMDTLAIYSFMYGPERERPCPGCTHFLDSLDGAMRHICERVNFVVVAKSPLERILAFAHERGWRWLRSCRRSPGRSIVITTCSIRCGTCSTSRPRGAGIFSRSSAMGKRRPGETPDGLEG